MPQLQHISQYCPCLEVKVKLKMMNVGGCWIHPLGIINLCNGKQQHGNKLKPV